MIYNKSMNKVDKIIQKFKQTNAGQRFEDCEKVLFELGFELKRVKGSHHQYRKDNLTLTIANHKPVAKDAVNDILKLWEKYHE